jgi:uncharacterized protein involved in exopolysaccharide biosynthesis
MQSIESVLAFLRALARVSLRHIGLVFLSVAVCVAAAAGFARNNPPLYSATMTVRGTPVDASWRTQTPSEALAAMTGPLTDYTVLLRSREVAQLLIDREHFDGISFGGRSPRAARPTGQDVQSLLAALLSVERDRLSNFATITCTSPSRTLCAPLLSAVNRQIEYRMTQIARAEAIRIREAAMRALPATADPDLHAAMKAALERANAIIVAADLGQPIDTKLLAPSQTPAEPLPRHPETMLVAAALLGLAAGMAIAWAREARRGAA